MTLCTFFTGEIQIILVERSLSFFELKMFEIKNNANY